MLPMRYFLITDADIYYADMLLRCHCYFIIFAADAPLFITPSAMPLCARHYARCRAYAIRLLSLMRHFHGAIISFIDADVT